MIYLDNAATTRVYDEVVDAMQPYFTCLYGNPSEIYDFATKSRRGMNYSRKIIADSIHADVTEIYFTSGGTESDNLALLGIAEAYSNKGKHIITTCIEHHAVINACKHLEKHGFEVTYLKVDNSGRINIKELERAFRSDTILVSVMFANNEIGTIQDIQAISTVTHRHGALFHTDGVQAFCQIPINVKNMGIDLLSASAHKCHGPKGIGFLYVKKGIKLSPFHFGGKQERYIRPGTENIPAIVGFGEAVRIASQKKNYNYDHISFLRNHFEDRVRKEMKYVVINGNKHNRLPGNLNMSFAFLDGEAIQIQLDINGICCSTGSACNAGGKSLSHVIKAIGVPDDYAYGTVRFTFSDDNTIEEIDKAVDILKNVIDKLLNMSTEYNRFINKTN
ncbi:MAG: cysteine desulfurase [Lachnospiraceae bacterium]|nr:cysteine desulfurase [Lachnospiraceae bacterium]